MNFWEIPSAVLILALASAAFAFRRRANVLWPCLLGVGVVGVCVFAFVRWPREKIDTARAQTPPQVRRAGYVAAASCQSCHPDYHATWQRTFHRTMTQVAGPETVIPSFENVVLEVRGETTKLEQRGDEFWATMIDPEWHDEMLRQKKSPREHPDPKIVDKQIVMTTGSHNMQAYWVRGTRGNHLYKFPWMYVTEDATWVPNDDAFLQPAEMPESFTPIWNRTCIKCHAVGGKPGLNFEPGESPMMGEFNSEIAELGISCEACHGPGEEHVAFHQDPQNQGQTKLDEPARSAMIHPGKVPHEISVQICGQCHGNYETPTMIQELSAGFSYRAAGDYEKTHQIYRFDKPVRDPMAEFFRKNLYWNDGACRIGGDEYNGMLETACFTQGKMTCLSCHSMHASDPDDQLAATMETNEACFQCHQEMRADVSAHTHHPSTSSGSLCYNCHMPHTAYALFKGIRSHRIDSPEVTSTIQSSRPNACNLCHLDKTLAWTADKLTLWYDKEPVELDPADQEIAASLRWILQGDAMQRVITAWNMGRESARRTSGSNWQPALLAELLDDSYSAVRYVAHRAIQKMPGLANFEFNYIGPPARRLQAIQEVRRRARDLQVEAVPAESRAALLLNAAGELDLPRIKQLLSEREDPPVMIQE